MPLSCRVLPSLLIGWVGSSCACSALLLLIDKCSMNSHPFDELITIWRRQHWAGVNNSQNSPVRRLWVPLPLELNCQIFECLKFGIQKKFIGGLGRGIYAIFRKKVLTKSKRLGNPKQNGWEVNNTNAIISSNSNGLLASDKTGTWLNVFANKGFPITEQLSRTDTFPGTILYYFEVTIISCYRSIFIGLSSEYLPNGSCVGLLPNSYAILDGRNYCWLSSEAHNFEWPNGKLNLHGMNDQGDVIGCGLAQNSEN